MLKTNKTICVVMVAVFAVASLMMIGGCGGSFEEFEYTYSLKVGKAQAATKDLGWRKTKEGSEITLAEPYGKNAGRGRGSGRPARD
jgi:hypothetical protein